MNEQRNSQPNPMNEEPSSMMFDRLQALLSRREEMWWEIGQLLDEVAKRAQVGVSQQSYQDYAQKSGELSAEEAERLRRVAHHFSRDVALRHGLDKLDALLDYLEALPQTSWAMDPMRVEIPVKLDSGDTVRLPVQDVTAEQLRDAARRLSEQPAAADPWLPRDVAEARDLLAAQLDDALGVGEVTVRIHELIGADGGYSLAIEGLDPFNAETVGKVLLTVAERLRELTFEIESDRDSPNSGG